MHKNIEKQQRSEAAELKLSEQKKIKVVELKLIGNATKTKTDEAMLDRLSTTKSGA